MGKVTVKQHELVSGVSWIFIGTGCRVKLQVCLNVVNSYQRLKNYKHMYMSTFQPIFDITCITHNG